VFEEFAIGDLDQLEMLFRFEAFGFVVLESIWMPELGLSSKGFAD